ncbi:hypothetical protein WG947_03075 [Pontibacter sp. H259]|uniref:hypothetical protein n=1 Tax=Pontibacter sp. H259 TaxID=3133421 RepID=UPI0030C528B3
MMKKFILACALVLTTLAASAQDTLTYKSSSIRVQFSGAWPTGDFNSDSFDKEYPPFAMAGPMLQISYLRNLQGTWYAGTSLALRWNQVDLDKFAKESDALVLSRESNPWQSVFTMADLQYQAETPGRVFYMAGSLGLAFNRKASIKVNTPFGTINQPAHNNIAPAYGFNIGIIEYFDKLGIGFELGILSTKPTFEVTNQQGRKTTYSQPMPTINFGISATYTL